ncbi:MAG: hypothetical protein MI784_05930 [Cytophagales bacterium]|nr:hypothetical protein [Cytophagales bacterium]
MPDNTIYNLLLTAHSWTRWFILLLALAVLFKSYKGWIEQSPFGKGDNALSAAWVGLILFNALTGFVLYEISPLLNNPSVDAMSFGEIMKNKMLRFWKVEHLTLMLLAAVIAQFGRIRIKRQSTDTKRHKVSALYFTIGFILILAGIPWAETGRLFRF